MGNKIDKLRKAMEDEIQNHEDRVRELEIAIAKEKVNRAGEPLTIREFSLLSGITEPTLRNYVSKGRLDTVRVTGEPDSSTPSIVCIEVDEFHRHMERRATHFGEKWKRRV